MVYLRFLGSSQPFFILSGCLMSTLSVKVAKSPLSQRSKLGDLLRLQIWLVARGTVKMTAQK